MSIKKLCDYCGHEFAKDEPFGELNLTYVTSTGNKDEDTPKDICCECQAGNICLNTGKRSRTRTRKPKVGRPRGSKNKEADPVV